MSRTFKTVNYEQALDLTVRLGDCLPPRIASREILPAGKIFASLPHTILRLPQDLRALRADSDTHPLACPSCSFG